MTSMKYSGTFLKNLVNLSFCIYFFIIYSTKVKNKDYCMLGQTKGYLDIFGNTLIRFLGYPS